MPNELEHQDLVDETLKHIRRIEQQQQSLIAAHHQLTGRLRLLRELRGEAEPLAPAPDEPPVGE